jgi:hypothetical protein
MASRCRWTARAAWVIGDFLASADEVQLRERLVAFYDTTVDPRLQRQTLARRCGLACHGLDHCVNARGLERAVTAPQLDAFLATG